MGIRYRMDGQEVELLVEGVPSISDLLQGFRLLLEHPDLPTAARLLIDVTGSGVIPSYDVIGAIAEIIADGRSRLGPRVAVVVSRSVRYGKARQLGARLERSGIEVQPFYARSEAVQWLAGLERAEGQS